MFWPITSNIITWHLWKVYWLIWSNQKKARVYLQLGCLPPITINRRVTKFFEDILQALEKVTTSITKFFEGLFNGVLFEDQSKMTKCFPTFSKIKHISRQFESSYILEIRYCRSSIHGEISEENFRIDFWHWLDPKNHLLYISHNYCVRYFFFS